MDWSNLANLAKKYMDADDRTSGELDADTFKQHLYGQSGSGGRPQGYGEEGYSQSQGGRYERPPQEGGYGSSYGRPQYDSRLQEEERFNQFQGGAGRPHEGRYDALPTQYERPHGNYEGYSERPGYGRPQHGEYGRPQEGYERPQEGYERPQSYERIEGQYGRPAGNDSYAGGYGRPQQSEFGNNRPHQQHSEYSGGEYDRPQSHGGRPPPGYPTSASGHAPKPSGGGGGGGHGPPADANPDVIHQLLGAFSSHTGGEQFTGGSGQYEVLAQLASRLTGQSIPIPMLEKLVKWKMSGLV